MSAFLDHIVWWISTLRCKHPFVRKVHGDEIIFMANGRRWKCLVCSRYLRSKPLP